MLEGSFVSIESNLARTKTKIDRESDKLIPQSPKVGGKLFSGVLESVSRAARCVLGAGVLGQCWERRGTAWGRRGGQKTSWVRLG